MAALVFDEFGRFHPRGLRASGGQWVAGGGTTYDVTIVDGDGMRLAVVGFTKENRTGTLFRKHSRRAFKFTGDTMDRICELAQQYEQANGFEIPLPLHFNRFHEGLDYMMLRKKPSV